MRAPRGETIKNLCSLSYTRSILLDFDTNRLTGISDDFCRRSLRKLSEGKKPQVKSERGAA